MIICLSPIIALGQFAKIFEFTAQTTTGATPSGSLYSDGTYFYGTTYNGGTNSMGTIFKIKIDGTGYVKLLDFSGTNNGSFPRGSFISDGTYLYGTTSKGGINDYGTVFKIKPDGTGFAILLNCTGSSNGKDPFGNLYNDGTYLYGMTATGGINNRGTMFKIKPDGTGYLKIIDFNVTNGNSPNGSFYFDGTYLYGMTMGGGPGYNGDIFKIKTDGTGFATIYQFMGGTDGKWPVADLISDGTYLYGTTNNGGINSMGTIFKIKPDGTGYTKILDFSGTNNGKNPAGTLYYDGIYLYGTTVSGGANNFGVLFKIKPDGTGYTKLIDFAGVSNGSYPEDNVIAIGTTLYGTTSSGGISQLGVVFKYDLVTSIADYDILNSHKIYPNPVVTTLTIENIHFPVAKIEIVNIAGKIIRTFEYTSNTVDVSDLLPGIYFVHLIAYDKTIISKFIKQ